MAWLKERIDPDTGAVANFWEVIGIWYDHRSQVSELKIGIWVSQATYEADRVPVYVQTYSVPAGAAPQLAQGAVQFVKTYALAQPEFANAVLVTP